MNTPDIKQLITTEINAITTLWHAADFTLRDRTPQELLARNLINETVAVNYGGDYCEDSDEKNIFLPIH